MNPQEIAVLHRRISYTKSALRLAACLFLPTNLVVAAIFLGGAEMLGILEEVYGS